MENLAVTNFREYVRINTMQPKPDYGACLPWLKKQAESLSADMDITEVAAGKPIVVLTVKGKDTSLPSIFLSSHMDVVPVFPEHWIHDPFSAHKDDKGNIYGRGTQDMKCVGVQYIEAIKNLQSKGIRFLRTIHIAFTTDEEIGSHEGMDVFSKSDKFKSLNIAFGLDEGYASQDDEFIVFYAERNIWQFWVRCPGSPGHGSQFLPNNAGKKIDKVVNAIMQLRDSEEKKLKENSSLALGDVTTFNLTRLEGGVQFNVVPVELSAGFDVRIPPTVNLNEFEQKLKKICTDAGDGITLEFFQKDLMQVSTSTEKGDIWWDTFMSACEKENIKVRKTIFPAGTDCRFVREAGIPAFGFSPMNNTPLLLHDHNEFLNEKIFLRGIEIYETIIKYVANVSKQ